MSDLKPVTKSQVFNNDLRRQFVLAMILVAVIPLTILSAGLYYYNIIPLLNSFISFNRDMLDRQLVNEQVVSTRKFAQELNTFFKNLEAQISMLSGIADNENISLENRQGLIKDYLEQFSHIRWMGSAAGLQVGVSSTSMQALFEKAQQDDIPLKAVGQDGMRISLPASVSEDLGKARQVVVSMPSLYDVERSNLFLVELPTVKALTRGERIDDSILVIDETGSIVLKSHDVGYEEGRDISYLSIVQEFTSNGVSEKAFNYMGFDDALHRGVLSRVELLNWGLITQRKPANATGVMLEMEAASIDLIEKLTLASILGLFSVGLLAGSVGALIAVRFTKPLQLILKGIDTVSKGDYTHRFKEVGPSDIRHLTRTLNQMIGSIEAHTSELQQNAQNMRKLFMGSLTSLVAAIDAKDPYTQGHSRRVQVISVAIGKEMGLTSDELEELEISALMHDIGKLGVDDALLKKPGVLSSEEREILELHPVLGAEIMRHMPMFQNMLPGMLHHHERWDGSGYPLGLIAQEIPIYGRIVAVADTFDAMTSSRPYQETLTYEEARDLITGWSGIRYDPVVVEAFINVFVEVAAICNTISSLKGVSDNTRVAK